MRVIPALLVFALLVFATEDLTPRAAGGWNGFNRGSWAKLKRTYIPEGRNAQVTIWKTTLTKVEKDTLTTETVVTNVVGMKKESTATVPRKGEAGKGEKESVAKLENETLKAAGTKFECARVRTTVTGPTGKRVIEEWTAAEPRVRVKRAETYYDTAGKVTMTRTLLLVSLKEVREVGERKVECQKYKMLMKLGDAVNRATAYTSRDVPGDMVYLDGAQTRDGLPVSEYRFEVLAFETK